MSRDIKQVTVTDQCSWGKWPHTRDTNFSRVLTQRTTFMARHGNDTYAVENRFLPAYAPYATLGFSYRHPAFPNIDNTQLPPQRIMDAQLAMLQALSKECEVIVWDHAVQCFPSVAQHLKELFKLSILIFADDCPGSSEIKTFPVAKYFNAYYHCMGVWSFAGGEDVGEMYRKLGVERCYFKACNPTCMLPERMVEQGFDPDEKIAAIARGELPPVDLAFVGMASGNSWRRELLHDVFLNKPANVTARFHGVGCPQDVIGQRSPVEEVSRALVGLYRDTLFGINPQQSSLFNTRLMDLWYGGVGQFIYDPHGELRARGFRQGEHYLPYNGSAADLYQKIAYWKARPEALAVVLHQAREAALTFSMRTNAVHTVFGQIYHDYLGGEA